MEEREAIGESSVLLVARSGRGHRILYVHPSAFWESVSFKESAILRLLCPVHPKLNNQICEVILMNDFYVFIPSCCGFPKSFPDISHFSLVFRIPASSSQTVVSALKRMMTQLHGILVREERRCGFVTHEINQAGAILEETPKWSDRIERLHDRSEICRELRDIIEKVRLCERFSVFLNGWIEFTWEALDCCGGSNGLSQLGLSSSEFCPRKDSFFLRGYHALVKVKDARFGLSVDSHPLIAKLTTNIGPGRSLMEAAENVRSSQELVIEIGKQLLSTGCVVKAFPVELDTMVGISKNIQLPISFGRAERFRERMPSFPAIDIFLETLVTPMTVIEIAQRTRRPTDDVIVACVRLIKRQILVEYDTYIRIIQEPTESVTRMKDFGNPMEILDKIRPMIEDGLTGTEMRMELGMNTHAWSDFLKFFEGFIVEVRLPLW
eukprot:TRINITY_DN5458_c0_g1_i1.p1 TRINITY_DN5458_c0_g1~~TRINITY_DN5458_c0_g1_i1.p1  ORF type:complete len:476 (+),score=117.40 TRINITY_DN5458_c0_g1_i1:119-1429(+)